MIDFKSLLKPEEFFKRQSHYFTALAAGIAFLGVLIGWQVWRIGASKINRLHQEISLEKKRNDLLLDVRRLQANIEKYQKRLPPALDTSWLIQQVTEIVQSEGLSLLYITPEKTPQSLKFNSVAVRFGLECTYHELGRLIARFESSPILLKIQELSLEKLASQEEALSVPSEAKRAIGHVEMILSAFSLPAQ